MKRSREVIIGLVAILTIATFIWLLNYLKGHNLFKQVDAYTVIYTHVNGLQESSPIEINGYQVGIVGSIKLLNDGSGRIRTRLSLDEKVRIPKNSIAEITPASLIAGMKVRLVFSEETSYHQPGDTLSGRIDPGVLGQMETKLEPLSQQFEHLLLRADSLSGRINQLLDRETIEAFKQTARHMETAGKNLSDLLSEQKNQLADITHNLHQLSDVLARRSEDMNQVLINMRVLSDTIASEQSMQSYQSLQNTLRQTDSLLQMMVNGQGTMGKIFTDESLYQNLNTSLTSLDSLLKDLRENPGSYVHFSLFGRKN